MTNDDLDKLQALADSGIALNEHALALSVPLLLAEVRSLRDELEASTWDDRRIPEDEQIEAAHPLKSGRHDLHAQARRLVGAKRSKFALVDLVNWLLKERETARSERDEARQDAKEVREEFARYGDDMEPRLAAAIAERDEARAEIKRWERKAAFEPGWD